MQSMINKHSAGRTLIAMVWALLLAWLPTGVRAQAHPTAGVVSDEFNNPIANVVVGVKGSTNSVLTDAEGMFDFNYKKGDVITFTHPDYLYHEVAVAELRDLKVNKVFTVHLTPKKVVPNEDFLGAYGQTVTGDDFIGSAATVKNSDLNKYLAPNVLTAIQGRVAGLNVSQYRGFSLKSQTNNLSGSLLGDVPSNFGSNNYGDNSQFSIGLRGQAPVVIVDGVQRDIFSLDPEAIESVTLEKDALSSMFLGMQSSRGALIINTKNPSKGAMSVSLTGKFGVHSSVTKLNPLNAKQYAYLLNEALQNDGKSPLYSNADFAAWQAGNDIYEHPFVDWEDQLLKNSAVSQSYNLSVSGGGKVAQYFVSLGYLNEQGLFRTDKNEGYNTNLNLNRYMLSSKVNINVTDDFTATLTAFGRIEEGNQPGGSGNGYSDLLLNIYNTPNNAYPINNPDGTWGGNLSFQNNLMAQTMYAGYIADNSRDVQASLKLNYDFNKLVKGLSVRAIGTISSLNRTVITRTKRSVVYQYRYDTSTDKPLYTMYGTNEPQSNSFTPVAAYQYLYGQLAADYNRTFGLHTVKATLMGDTRHELDDYDLPKLPSNIMESVKYDYDKRYFAQLAVTESYYNRYAPGNRWGTFWAAGLGWDMAREQFMENAEWLNQFKLRAVYGHTGNGVNNSGYYIWRQTYEDNGGAYYPYGESMSQAFRYSGERTPLANPYITWEKANKMNVGFDAALLNNRLLATFDFYNDKYYDLLQSRGKSIELLGISYPTENIGKNRRWGTELSLTWQDHVNAFNYYVTGNWTVEHTKLLFMDEQAVPYERLRQTGRPLGVVYGLQANGFLTAEDIANGYPVMAGFTNIRPGDVKYVDQNNDGVIDEWDRTVIGGDKPLGYFGLDLGFEWKGLEFSMLWQGVYNRDLYISNRTLIEGFQSASQVYGQAYTNLLNRWTPETASTATYPRLTAGGNNYNVGNGWNSSLWMKSGNFMRLKNISLAYNLPETLCKNYLGGVRVKVFVNAQNLVTFSACDLIDPEVTFTSSPLQRTIFTGVNLKF